MVPTINSVKLARELPNAELSIFPDAGHGAILQYHNISSLKFQRPSSIWHGRCLLSATIRGSKRTAC